jgi:uncharacterized FAD-dependent dehydrogenase
LLRSREPLDVSEGVRARCAQWSIPRKLIECDAVWSGLHASRYPGIEAAQYRVANTWKDANRAVYSFCMCPGGYVLNASSDTTGVVTNGMSNSMKSGRFSNAAIVVNVSVIGSRTQWIYRTGRRVAVSGRQ